MSYPAAYRSRYFYFAWLGLWLISLRLLGGQGMWVVPGMFLFFSPGFIVGEKLIGGITRKNPGPLVAALLIGMVLGGFSLFCGGMFVGFKPLVNLFSLVIVSLLSLVFFFTLKKDIETQVVPEFKRGDYYALLGALGFLLVFVLPVYYNVGRLTAKGFAYTPWFSLDFLLSKTYVAAVAQGKLPAANPFYPRFTLRYHYFLHALPAYLYQLTGRRIDLEKLLLFLYFLADAVFITSIYLLFCEKLTKQKARWAALILLLGANSFEGVYFFLQSIGNHPLKDLFFRNLEMRFVPSILTPYLHLLYIVPHLFTAAYFYLLYQLLTKKPGWREYLMAGLVIGASTGMSIFMAALLLWYCLLLFAFGKSWREKQFWYRIAAFAAGALVIFLWLALAVKMFSSPDVSALMQSQPSVVSPRPEIGIFAQADQKKLPLALFGLKRFVLHRQYGFIGPFIQIGAECLPSLFFLFWGIYLLYRQKKLGSSAVEIVFALSCLLAYLFVATNELSRTISHKVSLPLYLFAAVLGGGIFEENDNNKTNAMGWGFLTLFLVLSLPTLLFNFIQVNNLDNHQEVTYLSPSDRTATRWIKNNLPRGAVVQCFPNYPAWPHQYSLIPTFAERNTGVGSYKGTREALSYNNLAISEQKKINALFSPTTTPQQARKLLKEYGVGYLYFGPVEKRVFGLQSLQYLNNQQNLYRVIYFNDGVVIFQVKREK